MTLSHYLKGAAAMALAVAVGMPAQAQQSTLPTRQIQIERQDNATAPDQGAVQSQEAPQAEGGTDQGQTAVVAPADNAAGAPADNAAVDNPAAGQVVKVAPEGDPKAVKGPPGGGKVVKVAPGGDPKGLKVAPEGDPRLVKVAPGAGPKGVKVVPEGEPVIVKKPVVVVKPKPKPRYYGEYYEDYGPRGYGGYGYQPEYGYRGGYGYRGYGGY